MTRNKISVVLLTLAVLTAWPGARNAVAVKHITFEGTLLAKSLHPGVHCGILAVHQVAKYRVDRLLWGDYRAQEMVVDHLACEGDVFKDFSLGDLVRLTVRVDKKYRVITCWPGIREYGATPQVFYVAGTLLKQAGR
jgi:hypothetical protein